MTADATVRVHFGSLGVRVTGPERYVELFPLHFRAWPDPDDAVSPHVDLTIAEQPEARPPVELTDDPLELQPSAHGHRITTAITELVVIADLMPVTARLTVWPAGQDPHYVDHYVAMNVRAMLRILNRVQVHGAAVVVDGRTLVFVGDKGAGKSTLALAFGRRGATVLSDDQLVVHIADGCTHVSGLDGGLRVTAKTEAHYFAAPLDAIPQDFGGARKKEVPLEDHVATQPRVDHEPSLLFFPRVGAHRALVPAPRAAAAQRILAAVTPLHRFTGPADQLGFVRVITTLVSSVGVYDLLLDEDLGGLDRLVDDLAALCAEPS